MHKRVATGARGNDASPWRTAFYRARILIALLLAAGLAGASAAAVSSFTTALSGVDVAPAAGDPAANGFAAVTVVEERLQYYVWTRDLLAPGSLGLFRGDATSILPVALP